MEVMFRLYPENKSFTRLKDISNMSDEDVYENLKDNYVNMLKYIMSNGEDAYIYMKLFMNKHFVDSVKRLLQNVDITEQTRKFSNKIIYDFMTLKSEYRGSMSDSEYDSVKKLLLGLSKVVNRKSIPLVCALGIPENIAANLVMVRYSSMKEESNIKRLNFVMMNHPEELFSIEMVVKVYHTLFDRMSTLFNVTMFDVYNDTDEFIINNPDAMEVYANISNALICVLEDMSLTVMEEVLTIYYEYAKIYGQGKEVRFRMRSISVGDFPRIITVVEKLERNGIYLI